MDNSERGSCSRGNGNSAGRQIEIFQGGITRVVADAIVNAANSSLSVGGGVDGAIHRAAGPNLEKECAEIGGCPPGEVRLTHGWNLPAKYVIQAVGPIWNGGNSGEAETLENCYFRSVELAAQNGIRSIAFPAISTGVYGYPKKEAVKVAVRGVLRACERWNEPSRIIFVVWHDDEMRALYEAELRDCPFFRKA